MRDAQWRKQCRMAKYIDPLVFGIDQEFLPVLTSDGDNHITHEDSTGNLEAIRDQTSDSRPADPSQIAYTIMDELLASMTPASRIHTSVSINETTNPQLAKYAPYSTAYADDVGKRCWSWSAP